MTEAVRLGLGSRTGETLAADLVSSTAFTTDRLAGEDFLLGDGERLAGEEGFEGLFLGEGDFFGEGDLLADASLLSGELFPEAFTGDCLMDDRRGSGVGEAGYASSSLSEPSA